VCGPALNVTVALYVVGICIDQLSITGTPSM
jgi:hypothetical protein